MRSRIVSRPWPCCFATASSPPCSFARSRRRRSSSISDSQLIEPDSSNSARSLRIAKSRRAILEVGLDRLELIGPADQLALQLLLEREPGRRVRAPRRLEQALTRADRIRRLARDLGRKRQR